MAGTPTFTVAPVSQGFGARRRLGYDKCKKRVQRRAGAFPRVFLVVRWVGAGTDVRAHRSVELRKVRRVAVRGVRPDRVRRRIHGVQFGGEEEVAGLSVERARPVLVCGALEQPFRQVVTSGAGRR